MVLQTTVIGSFPKPSYLELPDWFRNDLGSKSGDATKQYTEMLAKQTAEEKEKLESNILKATKEVIDAQVACGINVVTDGEIRRENYIHYLCRSISGIDFDNLTEASVRNGAYVTQLPTVRGKVSWSGAADFGDEWSKAQGLSPVPVKYTLPGPMTIIGTLVNEFYKTEKELAQDLAPIVNLHVRALAKAGCKYIQIDEPVFARKPQQALDWGIDLLEQCFDGAGADCQKVVHMCCGYPEYLDQVGYKKADPSTYLQLAEAIDRTCIDAVSIEDAHCHNDLKLLQKFKQTKVIFGAVQVACSRVETVDEIEVRLREALEHIECERLIVAPDCGLALLPPDVLQQKLTNLCTAAKRCSTKRMRTEGEEEEEAVLCEPCFA